MPVIDKNKDLKKLINFLKKQKANTSFYNIEKTCNVMHARCLSTSFSGRAIASKMEAS
jgi:hypothetical protein